MPVLLLGSESLRRCGGGSGGGSGGGNGGGSGGGGGGVAFERHEKGFLKI